MLLVIINLMLNDKLDRVVEEGEVEEDINAHPEDSTIWQAETATAKSTVTVTVTALLAA